MQLAGKRPHGSLVDGRRVGLWFEETANQRLGELAKNARTSKSAMAQWLIETVETDENGVPLGWPSDDEQLPIDDAEKQNPAQ